MRQSPVLIVAQNYEQARGYARMDLNLAPGDWRYVTSLSHLYGWHNVTVVLCPGWAVRSDYESLAEQLRFMQEAYGVQVVPVSKFVRPS